MTRSVALRALPLLLLAAVAGGCSGPAGSGPADARESGRPPVAVDTARVAAADLEEAIEVVGALTPKADAEVKSEYSGVISEVYVTQWVRVQRGTPLAKLDSREAEAALKSAEAAVAQAAVGAARAAREAERTVQLRAAGLATQQALDEARSVEEAARAQVAAAAAQLDMARARLQKAVFRSPMDGVVAARSVNVGDYVENMGNPRPIFHIVDNRVLELTVTVPTARLAGLAEGQPLYFAVDALPGREFEGRVSFINPTADEASRTVKVKAEIANDPEVLKAGLFAKGRIRTGVRQGVVTVPRAALQSWDTAARAGAVFVVDGGIARRRAVVTGAAVGDRVEIVSGVATGDEVVVRGGFNLRDGDKVAGAGA